MDNALLYEGANSMQKRDAQEILDQILSDMPLYPGARVIDIGCGVGDITMDVIRPRLPKDVECLIGIDVSASMIDHAQRNRSGTFVKVDMEQDNILESLQSLLSDSENNNSVEKRLESMTINQRKQGQIEILINGEKYLEAENEHGFDLAFSFYCFHWIQNQRKIMSNLFDLLKKGGESLIAFLVESPIYTLYEKLSKLISWKDYVNDYKNFVSPYSSMENPAQVFKDLAVQTGFEIKTVKCIDKTFTFEDFQSLTDAVKAVNPFLSRVPDSLKDNFVAACSDLIITNNLTEELNGCHSIKYTLLVAHLRKPCDAVEKSAR